MISDPTPHEIEALSVADDLHKGGHWAVPSMIRSRIENVGILDDLDLRAVLASAGLSSEQIGESVRRVHDSMKAAYAAQEQA